MSESNPPVLLERIRQERLVEVFMAEGRVVTLKGNPCGPVNISDTEIGRMILRELEREKL